MINKICGLAFSLGLLVLGSCSASGDRFQALPAVDGGSAELIVYRPDKFFHGGVPYYVYIDDKETGTLRNAGFISTKFTPGPHTLMVKAGFEDIYREVKANISVVAGERKYCRFEPSTYGVPVIIPAAAYFPVALGLWQVDETHALADLSKLNASK